MKTKMKQKLQQQIKQKVKIKYKARVGSPFPVEYAQALGEEVSSVPNKSVRQIYEKAKNPNTTLYKCLDWDNKVAGEKWRLQQIRNIVSHIIEIEVINGEEVEVKSFFPVYNHENKENIYVTKVEAISNKSYKKQLLNEMKATLENLMRIINVFSTVDDE